MRFTLPLSAAAVASVFAFVVPALATTGCNAEGWGEDRFPDVWGCHSSYPAIAYVRDEGIVEGYPDGTYKPDAPINRAEFTKILMYSIAGETTVDACVEDTEDAHRYFPDVPPGSWYEASVCHAKGSGIIDGYPDGTFKPANFINYAEAAKIAANAYGLPIDENAGEHWGDQEKWFLSYSLALLGKHAVPPTVDGYASLLTRGEMAEMIYRLETGKTSFDWFKTLPDGDMVTLYSLLDETDVEISYPGSVFAAEQSSETIPDVYADGGAHSIRTIQLAYVRPDESEQGCDGMSGLIERCRPSKSDIVINVGIVNRAVEHLALGMSWRDKDEITSVAGRPARSFWEGIECEGRKFVFVPLDATRSLAITRSFDCNDAASFARQEELFTAFLENVRFMGEYVPQVAPTMEVTMLMCDPELRFNDPESSAPTVAVKNTVPSSASVADMTLRSLFANHSVSGAAECFGVSSLAPYYRGVTIMNGVATVKLSQSFQEIFGNDTYSAEYSVSAQRSITANLKQFPSVKDVRYVVQP